MLESIIKDHVLKHGPITFEKFMDMALYYPGLGYYSRPDAIIGKAGDFYTGPHLHPIFGAVVCRQLIEMWKIMDRPSIFHAVEMGAGEGFLCKDILDYLHKTVNETEGPEDAEDFLASLKYVIIEPYAHFNSRQKEVLKGYTTDVKWQTSIDGLGEVKGCVLSNELLDALPVHLVEMDDGLKEIYVNAGQQGLFEEKASVSTDAIMKYADEFSVPAQDGYRTEINLRAGRWLEQISTIMSGGFILTIDYGYSAREYYNEERDRGTLLCYHRHQANEDPFQNIGGQDITAHVNFSSLKTWGEGRGFKTLGYSSQGIYLAASGIDELIVELYAGSPEYMKEIARIKGLIMPQGMGESHRVMVQYKGEATPELRGFSFRNEAGNL